MAFPIEGIATSSIFGEGANAQLEAVDTFGAVTSDLRNTAEGIVNGILGKLTSGLGNRKGALLGIAKTLTSSSFRNGSNTDRLNSLLGHAGTSLGDLSKRTQGELLKQIGFNPQDAARMTTKINGVVQQFSPSNLGDATRTFNMLSGLLKDSDFGPIISQSATVAMFSNIMQEAANWHMPEITDLILRDVANNHDRNTRINLYANAGENFTQGTSISYLYQLVDAHPGSASAIVQRNPRLPITLLSGYRFDPKVTPRQYPEKLKELETVMDAVSPNWFETDRGDHKVFNLETFHNISADGKKLLSSSPRYTVVLAIANNFSKQSTKTIMKKYYPYLPV